MINIMNNVSSCKPKQLLHEYSGASSMVFGISIQE